MDRKLVASALTIFILLGFSACGGKRAARDPKRFIREHSLDRLPNFDIPIEMNDRVVAWMEYFQGPGRGHFRRYLERSGRYMPLMQEILKREGMPKDLIYIALIESGFNTQARSYAGAVGPWQFIQGTGRRYNLRIDGWVDERRDPFKSTYAAAKYLKDLYSEFGDWYLAMAGYNAGEGRVRHAIESTSSKNFWVMADNRNAFRAETRDYVPKYIAAAIIAKMPERFGFGDVDYREPFDFDTGSAETQTDISVIAKCAGTSEDDILDLNPHLTRGATPPGAVNYEVRIPRGKSKVFAEKYAALPKGERIQIVRHEVRKGDTLAKIARRYGVSAVAIASANGLKISKHQLKRGVSLIIPTGSQSARLASIANGDDDNGSVQTAKKRLKHTVKKGESLGGIAGRYGVTTRELMSWNGIKNPKRVRAGMKLVVRASRGRESEPDETAGQSAGVATRTHKVQRGETIATIARRYGVTPKALMAMNGISSPKALKAGASIVIGKAKAKSPVDGAGAGAPIRISSAGEADEKFEVQKAPAENMTMTTEVLESKEAYASSLSDSSGVDVLTASSGHPQASAKSQTGTPVKLGEMEPPKSADTKVPLLKGALTYQVKGGDTLWDIARRHKVSIAEIQKWNNLTDPSAVRPGTTLSIHR